MPPAYGLLARSSCERTMTLGAPVIATLRPCRSFCCCAVWPYTLKPKEELESSANEEVVAPRTRAVAIRIFFMVVSPARVRLNLEADFLFFDSIVGDFV